MYNASINTRPHARKKYLTAILINRMNSDKDYKHSFFSGVFLLKMHFKTYAKCCHFCTINGTDAKKYTDEININTLEKILSIFLPLSEYGLF